MDRFITVIRTELFFELLLTFQRSWMNVSYLGLNFIQYNQSSMQERTSTAISINCDPNALDQASNDTMHLINTAKVIKGHKLKMKDFLKLQLMKTRHSSPSKYEPFLESVEPTVRQTQYADKYRGFEGLEDERELHRFIELQRQKKSRQTINRIKLFSCGRANNSAEGERSISFQNQLNHVRQTPSTRQGSRTKKSNKTEIMIDRSRMYEVRNATADHTKRKENVDNPNKIEYRSQNLGKRMNEYLNLILQKKDNEENIMISQYIGKEKEMIKTKEELFRDQLLLSSTQRKKTNKFYRQMKKSQKVKIIEMQPFEGLHSSQLVKNLIKKTAQEEAVKNKMSEWKDFSGKFYSVQMRKNQKGLHGVLDLTNTHNIQKTPKQKAYLTIQSYLTPLSTKR